MTRHVDNKFEGIGIKYLNINIEDTSDFQISKFFKQAYEFMEEALSIGPSPSEGVSTSSSSKELESFLPTNFIDTVDSELCQFIDDLIDIEVVIDKNFPKLNQFGIISIENWREAFNSTRDLNMKNKILQIVYKHLFNKTKHDTRILIHCSMGVSRSPTIAIMYLMKKFGISFFDAYSLVQLHREKSDPIDSFLEELKELERNNFKFVYEY